MDGLTLAPSLYCSSFASNVDSQTRQTILVVIMVYTIDKRRPCPVASTTLINPGQLHLFFLSLLLSFILGTN